ncbi:MAG: 16S rRNA (adenine(1518)-N(6)/adenine(1519)-N(6))-dimethyltransferase RsmA [Candidatus Bipolaricaulota bacterium]|nr:16S rRNA (adenine(1518)-N(6)/adenine(1519)-N(6))-dimethyltransferase RsmA [Candidatus Bipolaricaulota bacterium]
MGEGIVGVAAVRQALVAAGIRPSKRLGQNFFVDPRAVSRVLELVRGEGASGVVEIGCGLGALTLPLADENARLVSLDVDPRLVEQTRPRVAARSGTAEVRLQDVLEFDFRAVASAWDAKVVVVGSIPYSITAPILKKLVAERESIRSAILVTQREVAAKVEASPGPEGTSLGVLVRAYADVTLAGTISRHAFYPVPEVDSCLWKLTMRASPRFTGREAEFFAVVRAIYGARRKTLRNALQRAFSADAVARILEESGTDGGIRGETLGFFELDALACAAEPSIDEGQGRVACMHEDGRTGKGLA